MFPLSLYDADLRLTSGAFLHAAERHPSTRLLKGVLLDLFTFLRCATRNSSTAELLSRNQRNRGSRRPHQRSSRIIDVMTW